MAPDSPALQRALELAASGDFASVNHVRQALRREGYTMLVRDLAGEETNRSLVDLLRAAMTRRKTLFTTVAESFQGTLPGQNRTDHCNPQPDVPGGRPANDR